MATGRRNAADRILHGATARLIEVGAVELSLHDVAKYVGVSKALIHYHFADKESLLIRVVEWTTEQVIARERAALVHGFPAQAVDELWQWLSGELEDGHLRVLLELAQYRAPRVQAAIRESVAARRTAAAGTVSRLFTLLELRPRVPLELLAAVVVTFSDGLALRPMMEGTDEARIAFDIFWLSVLSLAE
jgi:AcrR family transcriptional regulator